MAIRSRKPTSAGRRFQTSSDFAEITKTAIQKAFEMYNKYVYAGQKVPGLMDETRLAELQKFYVDNGVVPKAAPIKDLYTNQFVLAK